jgi:hypothetical protein
MEDTADTAERQADQLGGFANKIKGAMAAIVAGLAIGAAGVLSQVPVIGEAFAGLKAVFQAFAFQIDKRLRPGLTKINKEFFELANAIFAGDYEQAKKELKDIGSAIKNLDLSGAIKEFTNFGKQAISFIGENVNAKQLVKDFNTLAANAIGALVDGVSSANENLTAEDFQQVTSTVISLIKDGLTKLINAADWSAFVGDIIDLMGKFQEGASKAVNNEIVKPLTGYIEDNWDDWVDAAIEFGKDLVENIAKGIKQNDESVINAIAGMEIASGITLGDIGALSAMAGGPVGMAAGAAVNRAAGTTNTTNDSGFSGIIMDGRKMAEDTGRYFADASNRRF